MKYIIISAFICLCIAVLVIFYPVTSVTGVYSERGIVRGESFCFKINSDATVEYYINCEFDNSTDMNVLSQEFYSIKRLNIFDRIYVNKLVKKIQKGIENTQNNGIYYGCKIGNKKYYSAQFESSAFVLDVQDLNYRYNIDLIELCFWIWMNKPDECNEHWDYEHNSFPFEHMGITNDNYKEWIKKWRVEFKMKEEEVLNYPWNETQEDSSIVQ